MRHVFRHATGRRQRHGLTAESWNGYVEYAVAIGGIGGSRDAGQFE